MIKVIYYSQTGNTEMMANAVAEGIANAGAEAEVLEVSKLNASDLKEERVFALGCPAMGDEVLEEYEMEPFMEDLTSSLAGKKVALFGSYGWGDGEWMRSWEERVKTAGGMVVNGEGVICQEAPDDDALAACKALGKALTE